MSSYKQMEFDLRLSREASHARTFLQQEKGPELFTGIDPLSGRRCYDSPEMYTQRGLLRKMYQPCDLKGLPWSYKISARSGMWENFIVYPLVPVAALRIKGTESGSSLIAAPTATANQLCPSMMKHPGCRSILEGGFKDTSEKLTWPTPCARAAEDCPGERNRKSPALESVAQMAEEGCHESSMEKGSNHSASVSPTSGRLNPRWVEWLMGYPDGWTDLGSLETP